MICLGGSVLTSISKSEFDDDKSNSYFSVSIISLILFGLIVLIFGLLFSNNFVNLLCSQSLLVPYVKSYFNVLLLGIPFLCYMMSLSYFVRLDGIPNLAFKSILSANLVNIVLDIVFMYVFKMGITGAALATDIGYMVGSIYLSSYFFKSERTLKFISATRIKFKQYISYIKDICVSGFPSSSTQLFITLKLFFFNSLISVVLGKSGLVAFSICYNSLFILYMFLIGSAQTMSPIVSVYNNEEDYAGVNYIVKKALKLSLISSSILALIFIIAPQLLLLIYSVKNPADIPIVINAIRIFAISYIGLAITFLYIFYMQAMQKNSLSFVISIIEGLIAPILFAYSLVWVLGSNGIWSSFIFAELITIVLIFIYSKYYEKKTNGEYSGLFIIKNVDSKKFFDFTINAKIEEAIDLSKEVTNYLETSHIDDKIKTLVSLAIEEMLVNIINTNENLKTIDVIVKIQEEHILISIKDQGIEFNPTFKPEVVDDEFLFSNIHVLNQIADKIEYARVLGLNDTVITIKI